MSRRVAIVTGGASGIGLALGRQLAAGGASVVLADRNEDALERTVAELRSAGGDVAGSVLDVTDRQAVHTVFADVARRHGTLDLVFNNAGVGMGSEATDVTPEHWRTILDVNLHGVIHGVEAAYPVMQRQGSGHIVNTASVAGLVPMPGEVPYVTSKFAVVGLSHALRAEAADFGVRVSVVCPGVVATPIYDTSPLIGFDKDRVLAIWPKGIDPERCAARILRGVRRNQATIVVTPVAHVLWRLYRLSPSWFLRAAEIYMRRMRRTRA